MLLRCSFRLSSTIPNLQLFNCHFGSNYACLGESSNEPLIKLSRVCCMPMAEIKQTKTHSMHMHGAYNSYRVTSNGMSDHYFRFQCKRFTLGILTSDFGERMTFLYEICDLPHSILFCNVYGNAMFHTLF